MSTTTTLAPVRADQDYLDIAFALRCVERGEARAIRLRAGVTQVELARRVGVTQPAIVLWEQFSCRDDARRGRLPGIRGKLENAVAYGRELRRLCEASGDEGRA